MKVKNKIIASAVAVMMLTSAAPMTVSAASKAKAPSKVSITSVKRVNNTKANVKWKKLKKAPSGYAIYQKTESKGWKLVKKSSKKSASATVSAGTEAKTQYKVRAYKNGKKVKKYYNKKTKKFVSKKAYKKLSKKNRTKKKVTTVKWGKYSSVKTLNAVFSGKIGTVKGTIGNDMKTSLTWNAVKGAKTYEVYYSDGGKYILLDTVSKNSYVNTHYNPEKSCYYKVRPVNGAYTGSWSTVLKLNPQNMTFKVTYTKEMPEVFCKTCGEDITAMTEKMQNEKHGTTYYCSVCGLNSEDSTAASHNKEDIVKHIEEKHAAVTQSEDEDQNVPAVEELSKVQREETGNKKSVTITDDQHQHEWEKTTGTEERITGYKYKTVYKTICNAALPDGKGGWVPCNFDLTEINREFSEYVNKNGYTLNDDEYYDNKWYKAIKGHIYEDEAKGAKGWGSSRNEYDYVKTPIKENITVTKYTCSCGATCASYQ